MIIGENLLALVRAIANSDQLRNPGEDRHGHLVFFDLLGLTMVVYPKRIGEIINITTVVLVMLTLLYKTNSSHRQGWLFVNYIFVFLSSY